MPHQILLLGECHFDQSPETWRRALTLPHVRWTPGAHVDDSFHVAGLEVERLLSDWRWLYPSQVSLLARNVFGDLFLEDEAGVVFWLNTGIGKLNKVSSSEQEFIEMAQSSEKR